MLNWGSSRLVVAALIPTPCRRHCQPRRPDQDQPGLIQDPMASFQRVGFNSMSMDWWFPKRLQILAWNHGNVKISSVKSDGTQKRKLKMLIVSLIVLPCFTKSFINSITLFTFFCFQFVFLSCGISKIVRTSGSAIVRFWAYCPIVSFWSLE